MREAHFKLLKGTLSCAFGYLCIALMSACAKGVPARVPVVTMLFFQSIIPLILVLPQFIHLGKDQLKPKQMHAHLIRDVFGVLTFFTLFLSIKSIPLVDGVLLQNTAPLWVPFVAMIWVRKKIPHSVWLGATVGFIGVILVLKPGTEMIKTGVLMGIASGILLGISLVAIRRLSYSEPTARILFYYFTFGVVVTTPFLIFYWVPLTTKEWLLLIAIGIFMYLAQFFITYAFQHAKASTLAPISYTAVLWAGILGWLIWGHIPDWTSIFGMLLIIIGGIYTIVMEGRLVSA